MFLGVLLKHFHYSFFFSHYWILFRPETDEEKLLKEEINSLKSQEENWKSESAQVSAEDLAALQEKILQRERQLELLICQLDDKVRFGQRAAGGNRRPTSGAGRTGGPLDARPHSRSGVSEESRSSEFMERPRSRGGMADTWGKPMDDRRGFQSGYFSERNLNRYFHPIPLPTTEIILGFFF